MGAPCPAASVAQVDLPFRAPAGQVARRAVDSVRASEEQLAAALDAHRRSEQLRIEAVQRAEALEKERLQFEIERERWKQREFELAVSGHAASRTASGGAWPDGARVQELEALLREALLQGAQLVRERADVQCARVEAEQRVARLREVARAKLRRERGRADAAWARARLAEERLTEYVQASARGIDEFVESHIRHLVHAGQGLAQKVEEQAEIIEVLRCLLQDHKDFIRRELGASLHEPPGPSGNLPARQRAPVAPPAGAVATRPWPPGAAEPAQAGAVTRSGQLLPRPPSKGQDPLPDAEGSGSEQDGLLLDLL